MPTTFKVFSLGVQADLDTVEGNSVAENANALVGLTIGSAAAPLYNEIQTLSPGTAGFSGGNNLAYDTDNLVTNDEFRIDGGPDQIFDARGRYFVTLNYSDGTNDSLIVEIFQDTAGNTYLAPAENPGSSQSELEAKPIESIDILTVVSDSGGLDADRVDGTYATPPGIVLRVALVMISLPMLIKQAQPKLRRLMAARVLILMLWMAASVSLMSGMLSTYPLVGSRGPVITAMF